MRRPRPTLQKGVTMVEFALTAPMLLLLMFGAIDFSRIIQANTSVGEAARQGARQAAANQAPTDNPFSLTWAGTGPCSGTALSVGATGQGCLTDARIQETVGRVLGAGNLDSSPTLDPNGARDAATCQLTANLPAPGHASVCINPPETGTRGSYAGCAAAATALGRNPGPGDLGDRSDEWSAPQYNTGRCFLVQVTVVYVYSPYTGLLQSVIGNRIRIAASTSTVAEY